MNKRLSYLSLLFLFLFTTPCLAANRYWVGGTASWDGTANSEWSTSSGGAGGSAEPTAADDVFLDAASGAVTVTVATGTAVCRSLNMTGYTGTWASSGAAISIGDGTAGNYTLASGMTYSFGNSTNFISTTGTNLLTFNGKTITNAIIFNGVGGTWQFQDAFANNLKNVTVTNGTLDTNGMSVTSRAITMGGGTLTLGASTVTLGANEGDITALVGITGGTLTANTSTIIILDTGTNAKEFVGGGKAFNNLTLNSGGAGALTMTGANTFATVTIGAGRNVIFPAATTQTVTSFVGSGTAGNQVVITSSTGGSAATLSDSAGTNTCTQCNLTDSTAAGGATWNCLDCTEGTGNSGWNFITSGPANVKTINSTVKASVKTINGTAIASVKTLNGTA